MISYNVTYYVLQFGFPALLGALNILNSKNAFAYFLLDFLVTLGAHQWHSFNNGRLNANSVLL